MLENYAYSNVLNWGLKHDRMRKRITSTGHARKILGGMNTEIGRTKFNMKTNRYNFGVKTASNKIDMANKPYLSEGETIKFKRNTRTMARKGS